MIETWKGLDESGKVYVPDLPDFAVAVLAVPLPGGSVITVGNRRQDFPSYVLARREARDRQPRSFGTDAPVHHVGLNALEDRTPTVVLRGPEPQSGAWRIRGEKLVFEAVLDEATRPYFLAQPGKVYVYLNLEEVASRSCETSPCRIDVPAQRIPKGTHRLAVNWASALGPVGVAVQMVERR